MTLDQLEIFLATAEHLHFTKAAEALYITQPAVSAAIAALENEYRVKLFHRIGRHIEITETGRLLQLEARRILDQVILTERGLREFNNLQRGELKLGSSLTIGNYWLPEKISDFQSQYPAIAINCTLANTEEICIGTAQGDFDVALIEGEVKSDLTNCLEQEIIGSDRLVIIVGRSHPWYKRQVIELPELIETDWVMREPGSGTQQRWQEALENWGIDRAKLRVTLVLNTGEMVKAIVENSSCAAGISELMVKKELQLGTLQSIRVIDTAENSPRYLEFIRPFLKIKHNQRFQTRICQVFEQML
jgi:DNA-binding transcriptional LysR family regulator